MKITRHQSPNNDTWISMENEPPDEFLSVKDDSGNVAIAQPTYYTFKMIDKKIVFCDKYWDGGWMIKCNGLDCPEIGKITYWKHL